MTRRAPRDPYERARHYLDLAFAAIAEVEDPAQVQRFLGGVEGRVSHADNRLRRAERPEGGGEA